MKKVRLGDLCDQIRGVSYKPDDLHNDLNENSIMLLRANNIKDDKINFEDVVFVDKSKVKDEQMLKSGDILVCASSGSKDLVGKAAYINKDIQATFGAFCKVVRPNIETPKYIGHYFCSPTYRERISQVSAGVNINNIRNEHIDDLSVPYPPINIQNNIVERLDKLTDLINKRKQQLQKLDELVKARFVEMFGDPEINDNNLPITLLNELGEWNSGGTPSRTNPDFFKGNISWYSAGELNKMYLKSSVEKITDEAINSSAAKLFPAGSMLVGMYDTAAFKMGILGEVSSCNQACACIIPNDQVNIIWLYYELQLMKQFFLNQRRGVRQKNLNLGMIKKFAVPICEREQQDQFAVYVEQVDKSKSTIQKSLDKLELLKKALMQEYFG